MTTNYAVIVAGVFASATLILGLTLMSRRWRVRTLDLLVVGGIGYLIFSNVTKSGGAADEVSGFAQAVDLSPLKSLAVQQSGRIKSFDSVARTQMRFVTGRRLIAGQEPIFTFLDMLIRPQAYRNADVIYVKKKPIRKRISETLAQVQAIQMSVLDTFVETGLIAPALLNRPEVVSLLDKMEQDVIRTKRPVDEIRGALARVRPDVLARFMRVIPPADGDVNEPWHLGDEVWGSAKASVSGLAPSLAENMSLTWSNLVSGWRSQDATAVNDAAARLAAMVRSVTTAYPEVDKLKLENWYFRWKSMTWIWLVYLAAIPPLLMAVIYHWRKARGIGLVLFAAAFGLHTAALGLRWYISGRIPNSNMFEAITAATWLAGVVAIGLEFFGRRTGMRNLFALGAAVAGMTAMMCNHFMPTTLSPDIDNIMPVLHDVWLYIHTNMIILSYGLIAMATVTGLLYLRYRIGGGPPTFAISGGAGSLLKGQTGGSGDGFVAGRKATAGHVFDGATMVLMELSFITLWTGLVMGAIWADHSWGRPWGWDPKEVFALNTFIVFLVLVHVRFKVKDKGLWTAILVTIGCGVMLFNWIFINFVIQGLHSYA